MQSRGEVIKDFNLREAKSCRNCQHSNNYDFCYKHFIRVRSWEICTEHLPQTGCKNVL